MKLFFATLVIFLLLVSSACDPGMTIYQTNLEQNSSTSHPITVRIKSTRPFIGETWYSPDDVTVINSTQDAIVITKVELFANGKTYNNKPPGAEHDYPLTLSPGKTERLPVWFDLNDSVKRTFETQVELRVYYRRGLEESIARAFITGGTT
jgi:P pilus assembly chaperone PapD